VKTKGGRRALVKPGYRHRRWVGGPPPHFWGSNPGPTLRAHIMGEKQPKDDKTGGGGGRADAERRSPRNSSGQASLAGQLLSIRVQQKALAVALRAVLVSLGDEEGIEALDRDFPQLRRSR